MPSPCDGQRARCRLDRHTGERHRDALLTDYGNGGTATLHLNTAALGLPANVTAVNWEHPEQRYTAQDGIVTVPNIAQHDFRLLTLQRIAQTKDK